MPFDGIECMEQYLQYEETSIFSVLAHLFVLWKPSVYHLYHSKKNISHLSCKSYYFICTTWKAINSPLTAMYSFPPEGGAHQSSHLDESNLHLIKIPSLTLMEKVYIYMHVIQNNLRTAWPGSFAAWPGCKNGCCSVVYKAQKLDACRDVGHLYSKHWNKGYKI